MAAINRGEPVVVTFGQHQGKRGHVIGVIGHAESLMVEVQLDKEFQTTFHRPGTLSRDYEKR
jgi:ribosomal protein L24